MNVLVGGFKNSIALQPISIEGTNGLNIAAGIAAIRLFQDFKNAAELAGRLRDLQ